MRAFPVLPPSRSGASGGGAFDSENIPGVLLRVLDGTGYDSTLESGVPVLENVDGSVRPAIEVPVLTGNGSNAYAVSGSNIGISGAANRTVCFRCKLVATDLQAVLSWGAGSTAALFSITVLDNKWFFQGVSQDLDTGVTADTSWHHHAISYDGTSVRWYIDGSLVGTAAVALNTTNGPVNLLRRAGYADLYSAAQITDVRIYSDVKTLVQIAAISAYTENRTNLVAHWTCQDGEGAGTVNRNVQDTVGTNNLTLTNSTVTAWWANRTVTSRDWCILYGGGLSINGAFVPGATGTGLDVLGYTKSLAAGKRGNPYSRLVPNYASNAGLTAVGITSSVKLAPSQSLSSSATTDCGFSRIGASGTDRDILVGSALTGAVKTGAQTYTTATATNLYAVRGFADANYFSGPNNSGPTTFGTTRIIAKLLSVPPATPDPRSLVSRVSTGDLGFAFQTGNGETGAQSTVGTSTTTPVIPLSSDDIGKWFIFHATHDGTTLDLYLNGLLFGTIAASASTPSSSSGLWVGRAQLATGTSASHWAVADIAFSEAISLPGAIEADAERIMGSLLFALDIPAQTFRFNADDISGTTDWVSRSGSLTLTRTGSLTVEALS